MTCQGHTAKLMAETFILKSHFENVVTRIQIIIPEGHFCVWKLTKQLDVMRIK